LQKRKDGVIQSLMLDKNGNTTYQVKVRIKGTPLQKQQLMHWHTKFGHLNISDITSSIVAEERDRLAIGVTPRGVRSPATVNRYLGILRHMFTIARCA